VARHFYTRASLRQAIAGYEGLVPLARQWSRACEQVAADLKRAQIAMDTPIDPGVSLLGVSVPVHDASALEGSAGGVPAAGMTGPGIDPTVDGLQAVLRTIPKHSHQLGQMEQGLGLVGEHYAERAEVYRGRAETLREHLAAEPPASQGDLGGGLIPTDVERPPERPEPAGTQ